MSGRFSQYWKFARAAGLGGCGCSINEDGLIEAFVGNLEIAQQRPFCSLSGSD
jgi:hypothetical protein